MNIESPYANAGPLALRGNLHTHTTASDGRRPVQEVIDDYAARGYDFLMISDHDVFTSDADLARLDAKGMVLIAGNEISRNGPHVLHVHADRLVEPSMPRQQVILDANAGRGFVVVAHPNWQGAFDHCSLARMTEWVGYIGLEIYNGVIRRLDGSPNSTNKWDMLLAQGRRLWGFAHDDSHRADDVGLAWNVVFVRERTVESVVDAMRRGCFYGSTGVSIEKVEVEGNRIRIVTRDAERIVALQQVGKRIAHVDDRVMEVDVPEQVQYVRFECWGSGEGMAWTQPLFVTP